VSALQNNSALPEHIVVVHEYGAPRHFESLFWLARRKRSQVTWCNLDFIRRLAKAFLSLRLESGVAVLSDAVRLMKLLFAHNLTIVIGLAPFNIWILLILWLKRHNHVIYYSSWPRWNLHEVPRHPGNRYLEAIWRRALNNTDAVGVSGKATEGLRRFGARARQIPHSVDTAEFIPLSRRRSPAAQVRILFVGRLVEQKGIELLIEVARHWEANSVEWVFAGKGALQSELSAAQAEGLPIKLLSFVAGQELISAYQQADVFVLPSQAKGRWEELFGISLIEAMASGLPVVATDSVGPREIIDDGVDGFIVSQGDAKQLSAALQTLCTDKLCRQSMGKKARLKAIRRYDVAVVAALWEQVLCSNGIAVGDKAKD
jgi:glycosyltransferase involved in cell wall biosynthesis